MAASVPIVAAASIDQRFAQLIQQFGLTKNSFAISLGKTASVVQHLIDGRNKPGFDLMCKVFEVYPNVSRDWLLLGRGPMLIGSNNGMAQPVAPPAPTAPEPDFEPIDLADVAPRATRRPTLARLHPEEIAATLALASVAANGTPHTAGTVPVPEAPVISNPVGPKHNSAVPLPAASFLPDFPAEITGSPVAAAPVRPVARPFRPASVISPVSESAAAPMAAIGSQMTPVAAVSTPISAQPASAAPLGAALTPQPAPSPAGGAEAYVAAAIHAQHLQHQLALAELRNQHLLEQQQMLREMLAMARQSMV